MDFLDDDPEIKKQVAEQRMKDRTRYDIIENERKNICERGDRRSLIRGAESFRLENEIFEAAAKKRDYDGPKRKVAQEEKLAQELIRTKKDEIRDLKLRQQLRENSVELRDLESKLRAAYVNKELCAQMAEKEYLQKQAKVRQREVDEAMKQALYANLEAERIEEAEDMKRKMEYKRDLQDQMIMNYQQKQFMYEEFLREKKLLDDIIQRMHDEDVREWEDRMCKMKRTQVEIDSFKAAQEIWRQRERKELEEENNRLETYLKDKEIEEKENELQRQKEKAEKEKVTEAVSKRVYSEQIKKKEREDLILDLLEEEAKEKQEQRIKEEFKKQVQRRLDMQEVLARQLEERKEKLRQEELEDARYKGELMQKIIEDSKFDQMTAEKRRWKMLELRKDMQQHMQERRVKRAEELIKLAKIQEQDKILEENRKQIIEEERLKLLKEHAKNLIGYLPPGLLREGDLPHLGSEFLQRYSNK